MKAKDILVINSSRTDFKDVKFICKDALLDWIKQQLSSEQGFEDGEAEHGYKEALKDLMEYINKNDES